MTIKTNPYKAGSFVESAVEKALSNAAHLIADVKYDGVRGNILVDNTANAKWLSRVSKSVPALSYLDNYDSVGFVVVKTVIHCGLLIVSFIVSGDLHHYTSGRTCKAVKRQYQLVNKVLS